MNKLIIYLKLLFQSHDTRDAMVFLILIYQMCWSFSLVYISCELCQRMGNAFSKISNIIEQFEWYSFSFEMQKRLPIIIMNAQKTVTIKCFGSIASDRETFKKVSNTRNIRQTQYDENIAMFLGN